MTSDNNTPKTVFELLTYPGNPYVIEGHKSKLRYFMGGWMVWDATAYCNRYPHSEQEAVDLFFKLENEVTQ